MTLQSTTIQDIAREVKMPIGIVVRMLPGILANLRAVCQSQIKQPTPPPMIVNADLTEEEADI